MCALQDKYGMRFVEVAGCSADPDESVLLGTGPGHGGTGFDLLAAVYFPSSRSAPHTHARTHTRTAWEANAAAAANPDT